MFGDFDPVFPAADGTPDGAGGDHGEDAAEDADEDDPAQVYAQHGRHQHSCPKKTSEAMIDWMATTALKMLINSILSTFQSTQEFASWVLFYVF